MNRKNYLILILAIGAFGIVTTQLGVIGILPLIAEHFGVSISRAGLMVSLFALAAAISGPTMPLLLSGINRKKVMLLSLGVFLISNIALLLATTFTTVLIAYVLPAFFLPVYFSQALTVAAASVSKQEAPKAISKVFIGISATMVIGVPLTTFIASAASLQISMLGFALVNTIAFFATLIWIPSMPVKERLSYGSQLKILKKAVLWFSLLTVILMNGAIFGVYSFLAEYLGKVTMVSGNEISLILLVYGVANIVGNIVAGKLATKNVIKSVIVFPYALGLVYVMLFILGIYFLPMLLITFAWGILGGMGGIIFQYWVASAAPEAPDFTNGLFITSANLGTTVATMVCGLLISGLGIQYVALGGLLFLVMSIAVVWLRLHINPDRGQAKNP